jgi:RHS repeat-associated protein
MSVDIGFDTQAPSLPQGGGAVSGLGETFTPDLSTGSACFSVRLDCPNGPNDIGPRLTLRYDTTAGSGPFGLGFTIPLPRLAISTASGFPKYDGSDTLLLEGAGELLALPGGAYRPQVDAGAWRVVKSGDGFRATDREGLYYFLGTHPEARQSDADETGKRVFAWNLERIEDALGNAAVFTWSRDGQQLYLVKLAYGAYEVRFQYESRPDVVRWGRAGFLVTTRLRCSSIELHLTGAPRTLARRWILAYTQGEPNNCSLLAAVTLTGFDDNGASLDAPVLRLGYTAFSPRDLTRFDSVDEGAMPGPLCRTDRRTELIDWNGDGLPDLLEIGAGPARLYPNLGNCTWGRPRIVGELPLFSTPTAALAFADMNGDGLADIVRVDGALSGYIPRIAADGFGTPISWNQVPAVPASAPNARMADLDGDGIPDLIASNDLTLELFYRADPDGWSRAPQLVSRGDGPDVDFTDQHVSIADMTGDGTPDIVRVNGAGVTYWPYLGRGRWAAPVRMANSPDLPFDLRPERLFVSDVDGDGCADLIYLDLDRVLYWINQGGNGFAPGREIKYVPTGQITQARIADMRGSAAPGLLWSASAPFGREAAYYYLDFGGDSKPYLLSRVDNGVGAVMEIHFTTSAREAAADALMGNPWSTQLPVVIPVVASTITTNAPTGRITTKAYHYHDGRFDGVLREFAGFGRVDQDDIGDASIPTLRTTSWFHIGVDPDHPQAPMTMQERRRLRAIRGRIFRQERYGMDGTSLQSMPYDRTEQQWSVDSVDTAASRVDIPKVAKTVQTSFERRAGPASVMTTTNAAFDANGNITDSTQTSEVPGNPELTKTLRTVNRYAADPSGRFTSRLCRVQQFDGAGTKIADTITVFDGAAEGSVGAQGLITRKISLVLSDALATQVYEAAVPEFAALGYFRRAGEDGWWVNQATYERTDDASGLRGVVTGPLGAQTSFAFDANKTYPVRIADPRGNTVTAEYDYRACRVKAMVDASGAQYTTVFDPLARPVNAVHPMDTPAMPTTTYTYVTNRFPVEAGLQRRAVSGAAATVNSREFFAGDGKLIEKRFTDEAGEVIDSSTVYNSRGLPAKVFLPRRAAGATYSAPPDSAPHTSYNFDALGRGVRQVNPDGSVRTIVYGPLFMDEADEEDNRSGGPHAGSTTRRSFDGTGRLQATEQKLGGRTIRSTHTYDVKGNLVAHADANGATVRIWYDFLSRVIRIDRPEQSTRNLYDAAGNAVEARSASGTLVVRDFDECNRPASVHYAARANAPIIRFAYHDQGRPAPPDAGAHTQGQCVRIDDEGGATIFDYDARGRRTLKRSRPTGFARTLDLNITYRSDGQIDTVQYPDNGNGRRQIAYQYNARGMVSAVQGVIDAIEYDEAGGQTRIRYSNGVDQTFSYDPATRRFAKNDVVHGATVLRSTAYTWDLAANLTRIDSPNPKLASTFVFDDLYRLTDAATTSGRHFTYAYDDGGNITNKSDIGAYKYGEGGAPATCLTSAGSGKFTYNEFGDMRDTPWGTQTFNPMGHLTQILGPAGKGQLDMAYDYAGNRVSARSTGVSQAVDLLTPDPMYSIESGTLVAHIFDGMRIAARIPDGAPAQFLHADHLGGVALITGSAGQVLDSIIYDPYGAVLERTASGAITPVGFTGGVADQWSGLLYLQARYYAPSLGRFVSPDPIVGNVIDPSAWSPYAYCRNNPVTFVDPTGRSIWAIILAAVAIVALVVVSVLTFGATTGLLIVAIGIIAGGVVGGVSAAKHGGDLDDILTGIFVGAAVGGWAAFASVYAGAAVASGVGVHGFWGAVIAGGVNGAINGAAIGFAAGFAGGKGSIDDIWKNMLAGAIIGLVSGAVLGGISNYLSEHPPTDSWKDVINKSLTPQTPQAAPPSANAMPPSAAPSQPFGPAPQPQTFGGAMGQVGTQMATRTGGALASHALEVIFGGPLANAAVALAVDGAVAVWDLGYAPDLLKKAGVISFSGKW